MEFTVDWRLLVVEPPAAAPGTRPRFDARARVQQVYERADGELRGAVVAEVGDVTSAAADVLCMPSAAFLHMLRLVCARVEAVVRACADAFASDARLVDEGGGRVSVVFDVGQRLVSEVLRLRWPLLQPAAAGVETRSVALAWPELCEARATLLGSVARCARVAHAAEPSAAGTPDQPAASVYNSTLMALVRAHVDAQVDAFGAHGSECDKRMLALLADVDGMYPELRAVTGAARVRVCTLIDRHVHSATSPTEPVGLEDARAHCVRMAIHVHECAALASGDAGATCVLDGTRRGVTDALARVYAAGVGRSYAAALVEISRLGDPWGRVSMAHRASGGGDATRPEPVHRAVVSTAMAALRGDVAHAHQWLRNELCETDAAATARLFDARIGAAAARAVGAADRADASVQRWLYGETRQLCALLGPGAGPVRAFMRARYAWAPE